MRRSNYSSFKNIDKNFGNVKEVVSKENFCHNNDHQHYDDKIHSVFNNIYKYKAWGDEGGGSGSGSTVLNTLNLRNLLSEFVIKNNINSMIDLPCGACTWTSVWLNELKLLNKKISYYGVDIANEAIEKCIDSTKELSDYHNFDIRKGDISTVILPKVDLLFSRDTLQHLPFEIIFKTLMNFAECDCKYYIIGGYDSERNIDIQMGDYFPFNISKAPFSIKPDIVIPEKNGGNEPAKYLFIFKGDNFRSQISNLKSLIYKNV